MSILRLPSDSAPFEPLTEREQSILALMAEGLSDREIAERLVVAYTTVKWYNRQIFNKLGVDNRKNAIQRGRDFHLLSSGDEPTIIPKHNLPAQLTPFIGREREISELVRLLREPDVRLITILAPGGMGKTRLALAVAEICVGTRPVVSLQTPLFPNGVYFVPLAALSEADNILTAIANSTGYPFQRDSRTPRQQVMDYLANKTTLLVLDNFEHLLDGVPLITDLLQAASALRILVTSRERLNLHGETVYTLSSMDYPASQAEDVMASSAARLFLDCAARVHPGFKPESVLPDIARVCRLVQGMPLAVELAAAWVEVLTPGEIADEISHSLDFLVTEQRDVPERLRSVRAVFESTWRILSDDEQTAFMKLSVFRGGCTRKAALTVAGVGLRALTTLADKALITWIPDDERYVVHELLRQYAAEQLERAGSADATRDAHSRYYASFMSEHETDIKGRRQLEGLNEIETEFENLRVAWLWAADHADAGTIGLMLEGLYCFCEMRYRYHEYRELTAYARQRLTPKPGEKPHPAWVRLLVKTSAREPGAADIIQQGMALAQENDDHHAIAAGLLQLAIVASIEEDFARSVELGQESLKRFRALDDDFYVAESVFQVAAYSIYSSQFEQALACSLEVVPLFRKLNHWTGLAKALWNVGSSMDSLCMFDEAEAYFIEAVETYRRMGNHYGAILVAGWHLTWRMIARSDLAEATRTAEALLTTAIEYNNPHMQGRALTVLGMIALEEEDYNRAYELGDEGLRLMGTHPLNDHPRGVRATAAAALGNLDMAREYIRLKLLCGYYHLGDPLNQWDFDAVAHHAYLLALDGRKERAAEWFGLASTCPFLPGSRYYRTLRARLQAELGADVYAAAFERGKTMPLTDALRDLMAEEGIYW